MTVRIMPDGTATVVPQAEKEQEKTAEKATEQEFTSAPFVYESLHTERKRKGTGSFGDVVFVQLVLSVILAAGLWAGCTFGSGEIKTICLNLAELFR